MDIHWVGPSTIVTNQPFVPTYIYSLFGYFAFSLNGCIDIYMWACMVM